MGMRWDATPQQPALTAGAVSAGVTVPPGLESLSAQISSLPDGPLAGAKFRVQASLNGGITYGNVGEEISEEAVIPIPPQATNLRVLCTQGPNAPVGIWFYVSGS